MQLRPGSSPPASPPRGTPPEVFLVVFCVFWCWGPARIPHGSRPLFCPRVPIPPSVCFPQVQELIMAAFRLSSAIAPLTGFGVFLFFFPSPFTRRFSFRMHDAFFTQSIRRIDDYTPAFQPLFSLFVFSLLRLTKLHIDRAHLTGSIRFFFVFVHFLRP